MLQLPYLQGPVGAMMFDILIEPSAQLSPPVIPERRALTRYFPTVERSHPPPERDREMGRGENMAGPPLQLSHAEPYSLARRYDKGILVRWCTKYKSSVKYRKVVAVSNQRQADPGPVLHARYCTVEPETAEGSNATSMSGKNPFGLWQETPIVDMGPMNCVIGAGGVTALGPSSGPHLVRDKSLFFLKNIWSGNF